MCALQLLSRKTLFDLLPFFSTLQPEPLQLRRELRVQQRRPPTPGCPPPPRHRLAPLPGRGGHCDRPGQPGVPQLPAVGRGAGIQREGTPTFSRSVSSSSVEGERHF